MSLTADQLEMLATTQLVVIETKRGERVIRTTIWVAVNSDDVYIRSVRGEAGRWYRRAIADPDVTLEVGDERLRFNAVPATDPESIEAASAGLREKYRGRSLENMLLPETLNTTLRLEPR
ncbi:MAG TPA: nitroreductase/quinone reductase family protein [Acidimicrobiia bacterium]|nr:hypothetical protein [Acidimicrobiia bacterium]HYJ23569.1 nitroreductase/quinone reductase family protein [Acidimicrobiia bacterium]